MKNVIRIVENLFKAVRISDVANEIFKPSISEMLPHIVLLLFITGKNPYFFDVRLK